MAMDRAEFESDLQREGKIEPNVHRGSRAHEFDARLFVLQARSRLSSVPSLRLPSGRQPVMSRQERCTKNIRKLTACDI